MRLAISAVALLALAACGGPSSKPVAELTPEEMGQDDPNAPMEPDPDPNPMTFDAMSKTAESFTGAITLTAEPRPGPNATPRMKLVGANGVTFLTELIPGGAEQAPNIDWKSIFGQDVVVTGNPAPGAPSVDMHGVVEEHVPNTAPNGGFCGTEATSFIAMASGLTMTGSGDKYLSIAAFKGNQWPPADDTALCGTFNYAPPQ
jgi:hypothetical protein